MIDLTDQLRRYAVALEEHLDATPAAVVDLAPRRHPRRLLPVVAAAALVVGVVIGVLARDDGDGATVPVSAEADREVPRTSTTADASPATTVEDDGESEATELPVTTTSSPPTTAAPPASGPSRVSGSATWIGRDPRATLRVAACPTADASRGCPSMFTAPVADDGSFVLTLPSDPPQWQVAAYVSTSPTVCIFGCEWAAAPLGAVRSGVVIVDTSAPPSLTFSVSARVVDVFVRDGNGELVDDGGVQATDTRCPGSACPDGTTPMFVRATPSDGAVRLVVDPNVIYEFHGQAKNTGWSDPPYANDSGEFWFSPNETMLGADLEEGHVFTIEGAPSG